ncbi:MAG: M1 family aminopeptidase, partial [Pseudomonadota bacterium]
LIHRERECGVSEIMSASPVPDWLMPLSKTIALCSVIGVLLVAVMLTSISLQALDGYTNFELGLYLRSITLYNGFYFWMLCILAVLVQTLVSNKWLGMLLLFVLYIGLFTMSRIGFEHILYSFQIPFVIYSDMNGFGHLGQQVVALVIYWGFFCTLLIVTAHLLYPRGNYASFAERLHDARERINKKTGAIIVLAIAGFVGAGSWIFYNTNVLNRYQATDSLLQARADYELDYGQYENKPTPSYSDIDMTLDIFPEERRAESRGTAILTNNKNFALSEFMITTADTMQVNVLKLDKARLTSSDAEQGAYLFTLETPLAPGETLTMNWNMSLINQGFANSNHDFTVVKNGTLVNSAVALPALGFNEERKLTNNTQRKQFGLPPEPRLPALGDPDYINTLILGVDARTAFHVVMSTSADQTAVAPGALQRYWNENGRNYFEYRADRLIWPVFSFNSARYEVARDKWNNVDLEIYYDPKHSYNVAAMLNTAKMSLDYFTTAYSPYAFSSLRIVEYPRYRTSANPFPGIISYSEAVGFTLDLSLLKNIDYATIHELAHMWWGHQAYGARMQGRQMLNETLAQYSTLMMYKRLEPTLANRIIGDLQRGYLQLRNEDTIPEQPLMYTENQGHISYNKGPLAFYALQELIGEDAVNQALRNYLSRFAYKGPPFPMSRDLVDELRAVAGPDYQDLITDLFERIMLYNLELKEVVAVKRGDGYELTLTIDAHQLEADGLGAETEVPLHTWFDIALFSETENLLDQTPIYNAKHLLTSGSNTITINVPELPAYASVDPYQKMADREAGNNGRAVVLK